LSGVRILDLSTIVSGPLATAILADQGAEVIKVEAPPLGDMFRYQGPRRNGASAMFHTLNRNKRSIVLNLKAPEGLAALRRLIATADVLVHNFRPKVMGKLGLGYEAARALRPDLIYVSISGYGEDGPMADRPAYDNMIQCLSGMAALQAKGQGDGAPTLVHTPMFDKVTSWTAAQAVTAALVARAAGRGGQEIKVSMLAAAIAFLWPDSVMDQQLVDDEAEPPIAPADNYRVYRFRNGYVSFHPSDASFLRLCRALGATEGEDVRVHNRLGRFAHLDVMARVEAQWRAAVAEMDVDEGIALLQSLDVPCGKVLSPAEVVAHPQVVATEVFAVTDHPVAGKVREPRHPIDFSATPAEPIRPASELGADAEAVLAEAGYGSEEIARLKAAGVLG
jgi:crotonobetainyl-CoA:carnitine CoA-transferase CaiB-like acyl-CoA transferase